MFSEEHSTIEQDPSRITLERIFTNQDFKVQPFGPARWLEDDSGYTVLETVQVEAGDQSKRQEIVLYDLNGEQRRVLVSAEQLTPPGAGEPLKVAAYHWSADRQHLLIFTNTKRVWRHNTRGDYWVLQVATGELQKLGGDAEPSTLFFAKFSPNNDSVAYVRENNIYVEHLASGEISQLTTDGSDKIINGTSDWVYEEELHIRDCFLWSRDGRSIAYWQLDTTSIKPFYLINNTDTLYPQLTPIPYPKVGTTNPTCRIGVVAAAGGATIWVDLPGDPADSYIPKMEWAAGSEQLVIQQLNRQQNCIKVMLANISDGSVELILTETDEAWVELHAGLKWLDDGRAFIWQSERDGWRHLYRVSRDGRTCRLLTPGNYDVINLQAVDEQGGWLYFRASPDDPTQRYLYRVALDGEGTAERVTPAGVPGTHTYHISPKARWAFHTYHSFDRPPVTTLITLPDHQQIKLLEGNEKLQEKLAALDRLPVEFFKVPIGDDVVLDAWCIKPPDFNPDEKYPVLFYIYGEPSGVTVVDEWGGARSLWHQMLAQQGFLVMSVDSSGTHSPRGRAWRKAMYRQLGTRSAADQAAAVRAIITERPYVDAARVGIWGWSGGGTMTLNLLFRYPDIYRTGVAVAVVSDQRLYDTIFQERYMDLLENNEAAYIEGSPITHAHKLEGNLLLVHGTGDDNVHYQSFERLVNELVKHNKRFTMMSYPNRRHGINEGENTSRHLHDLMTRFLEENL